MGAIRGGKEKLAVLSVYMPLLMLTSASGRSHTLTMTCHSLPTLRLDLAGGLSIGWCIRERVATRNRKRSPGAATCGTWKSHRLPAANDEHGS
jgi:hypothetical protein